jgi:serine/threonine protein kinase
MSLHAEKRLGNYRLICHIGTGNFAQVYLGEHIHHKKQVALKILSNVFDEKKKVMFEAEAKRLVQLKHSHIIRILDFGVEENLLFLAMDYASKGTLQQHFSSEIPHALATLLPAIQAIASALQYAHDQRIIHRDVKPANMLMLHDDTIVLSDFNLAVTAHHEASMSLQDGSGTPFYMAPEQAHGKAVLASDQYALAAVVYEWLCGVPPFQGSTLMEVILHHLQTPPPPLRQKNPTITSAIEAVVLKALSKEPNDRFVSVEAFTLALVDAQKQSNSELRPLPQQNHYSPTIPLGIASNLLQRQEEQTLPTSPWTDSTLSMSTTPQPDHPAPASMNKKRIVHPSSNNFSLVTGTIIQVLVHQSVSYVEKSLAYQLLMLGHFNLIDFSTQIDEMIKKTFHIFFQKYSISHVPGIIDFLSNPAFARAFGTSIFSRTSPDHKALERAWQQHLCNNAFEQQHHLTPHLILLEVVTCYRQALSRARSLPVITLLLALLDLSEPMATELQASKQQMQAFLEELQRTQLSSQGLQDAVQAEKQHAASILLETIHAASSHEATQQRPRSLPSVFVHGLCKGCSLTSSPSQFFVSHGFRPTLLADWRTTLTLIAKEISSKPLTPFLRGDSLTGLCSICAKLYTTRFSLFFLPSTDDRNVYIELGLALGMGIPLLLIQSRGASVPSILESLSPYTSDGTFSTIRQELPAKLGKIEEYDFAAVRFRKDLPIAGSRFTYVLASGDLYNDSDVKEVISTVIKTTYPRIESLFLSQVMEQGEGSWQIERLMDLLQASRFAIYRINKDASPLTFLALGISIALNRPFILLRDVDSEVPSDVTGLNIYSFTNFTEQKNFLDRHRSFFDRYAL